VLPNIRIINVSPRKCSSHKINGSALPNSKYSQLWIQKKHNSDRSIDKFQQLAIKQAPALQSWYPSRISTFQKTKDGVSRSLDGPSLFANTI